MRTLLRPLLGNCLANLILCLYLYLRYWLFAHYDFWIAYIYLEISFDPLLPRIRATDFRNCIGYIDQLFTRVLDRQTNFRYLCTWIQRTWLVGLNYNEPLLNRYLLLWCRSASHRHFCIPKIELPISVFFLIPLVKSLVLAI